MEQEPVGHLTDLELNDVVQQLKREFPSMRETMLWWQLRTMGFRVTRSRVRHALRETDPMHTALRWRGELTRRQPYSEPGPNSLWHIGKYTLTLSQNALLLSWAMPCQTCAGQESHLTAWSQSAAFILLFMSMGSILYPSFLSSLPPTP